MKKMKRVEDSLTEQTYLLMHRHINGYGRLFRWPAAHVDRRAGRNRGDPPFRVPDHDGLHRQSELKKAAFLNDTVVLIGKITHVGRSSMEVRVDTYVETLDGMRHVINRAYVVMVAIDEEGKAVPVPGLIVETESEKAEWEAGETVPAAETETAEGF